MGLLRVKAAIFVRIEAFARLFRRARHRNGIASAIMSQSSSSSSHSNGAREFEASKVVNAQADAVYDFVSDIKNMPKYMPTTKKAESQGKDRVRVQGGGEGFQYDSDGYLRRNSESNRLEWGADEGHYSGWMEVQSEDEGAKVTIHLFFKSLDGIPSEHVGEGLETALSSIKNHVEVTGGKVKPRVEK